MRIFQNSKLIFETDFCVLAVLAIMLFPLKWSVSWFVAAFFHEMSHYLTLLIFKIKIFSLRITASGAILETEPMSQKQEIISALAGPLGGCGLLFFLYISPTISICALFQTLFNLLPIFPLDGGRVLLGTLILVFGKKCAMKVYRCIAFIIYIILFLCAGACALYLNFGMIPLILTFLFFLRTYKINALQTDKTNSTINKTTINCMRKS